MSYETNKPTIENREKLHPFRRIKVGAGVLLAVAVTGGIVGGVKTADYLATNGPIGLPEYSQQTKKVVIEQGQGIGAVVQQIDGIENVDSRLVVDHVKSIEANQKAQADGIQAGDTFIVPDSVEK